MNTTRYIGNGDITLGPVGIHIRPTIEEQLAASRDEYAALLTRHHKLERVADRTEERLLLIIIVLICVAAACGFRSLVWEQRAVRAGWAEVGR